MRSNKTLNINGDFFEQTFIKKIKTLENGDKYILIFLKLQLISSEITNEVSYEKIDDDFLQELALKIDEKVSDVEDALSLFEKYNLIKFDDKREKFIFYKNWDYKTSK